jgi:hypothetical protein
VNRTSFDVQRTDYLTETANLACLPPAIVNPTQHDIGSSGLDHHAVLIRLAIAARQPLAAM